MSWKGFSKAISRLPHQAKAKSGRTEVSTDDEYLKLQMHFNEFAYYLLKMQKEVMVYRDSVRDVILAHCSLVDGFAYIYDDPDLPEPSVLEEYLADANKTRAQIQIQLEKVDTVLLGPLNELSNVLSEVEKTMAKRSRKKLDYDRYNKNEKGSAVRDYEELNKKLKQELPLLFSYVRQIMRSLFVRLHGLQGTIYKLFMNHVSSQDDLLPVIGRNTIDDYHERLAPIPEMIESLNLFQLHRQKPGTAPIPPPKFLDEAQKNPSLQGFPDSGGGIGLGIIPNTYENQDLSSSSADRHSRCYGVALSDYEAQGIGDISFHKNQPIEVLESEDNEDGWWTARSGRETGLIPSNRIRLLQQEHMNT